jgi:hypothetical protein
VLSADLDYNIQYQNVDVLVSVEVYFYVNAPYAEETYIGRALVPLLLPGDDGSSDNVTWTPPPLSSSSLP